MRRPLPLLLVPVAAAVIAAPVFAALAIVTTAAQTPARPLAPAPAPAHAVAVAPSTAPAASLQVGDPAPAFSLPGTDGRTYTLAEFRGVQPVVLAWIPKSPIRE